VIKEIVLQIM